MNLLLDILGTGLVNSLGRGEAAWGESAPSCVAGAVHRVAPETLQDRATLRDIRRADRFSKMSVLAAWDAAGPDRRPDRDDLGILVTTAFGPHATTFEFLDEILDFGDAAVSPTRFSHSVHNAAAAYIAIRLASRGPACTLTDFHNPLYTGLRTAALWLEEGWCKEALVGYTEEISGPMEKILALRREAGASDAALPFGLTPGARDGFSEGSLFLRVGRPGSGGIPLDAARFEGGGRLADVAELRQALRA